MKLKHLLFAFLVASAFLLEGTLAVSKSKLRTQTHKKKILPISSDVLATQDVSNVNHFLEGGDDAEQKAVEAEAAVETPSTTATTPTSDDLGIGEFFEVSQEKYCASLAAKSNYAQNGAGVGGYVYDPWNIRICDGPVSHLYDVWDDIFETQLQKEFVDVFDAFSKVKPEQTKEAANMKNTPAAKLAASTHGVSIEQVLAGVKQFKWAPGDDRYKREFQKMDRDGSGKLNFQQFTLFAIEQWRNADPLIAPADCEHCFAKTRQQAIDILSYADCNEDGQISSEDLYDAMMNWNAPVICVSSTTTNDFILKNDEKASATVNVAEITKGIMVGYWQRFVGAHGIIKDYIDLKKVRISNHNQVH